MEFIKGFLEFCYSTYFLIGCVYLMLTITIWHKDTLRALANVLGSSGLSYGIHREDCPKPASVIKLEFKLLESSVVPLFFYVTVPFLFPLYWVYGGVAKTLDATAELMHAGNSKKFAIALTAANADNEKQA